MFALVSQILFPKYCCLKGYYENSDIFVSCYFFNMV